MPDTKNDNAAPLPTFFISHGGGPWPWMKEQVGASYDKLSASLSAMAEQIGRRPDAVLMVSAHWEAQSFTVQGHPRPPMIYDYYGFPAHTYDVHYDAPGSPQLARSVQALIAHTGLSAHIDPNRGYDHGMFTPMALMYPRADMPTVQLSLKRGLDPAEHLALGRAIAPLRHQNVLIIASGLSYHNLAMFGPQARQASRAFDEWLGNAALGCTGRERNARLLDWSSAPAARLAHPREEHLIPLMVAVGAAQQEAGALIYHEEDFMGGISVSSFRFGAVA